MEGHDFKPTHTVEYNGVVTEVQLIEGDMYTEYDMLHDVPYPTYTLSDGKVVHVNRSGSTVFTLTDAKVKSLSWENLESAFSPCG